MCTKPRIIAPHVFYHVTSKGVSGEKILKERNMKEFFLKQLAVSLEKFSFQCCAWSVMDDHYHLIVKSSDVSISKFMQRLNSVYAKKFNREKSREGVVFFRRYASIISEETELKKLIRYVHLNPVRCGSCTLKELDNYEWCGHENLINANKNKFLDKKTLLSQFSGSDPLSAYRKYVTTPDPDWQSDETIRRVRNANRGKLNFWKPELWVIGSDDFIRTVLEKDRCRKARIARHITTGTSLDMLHELLQNSLHSEKDELFLQGRINQKSTARELFAHTGACCYDFRGTEIAEHLKITASAVSRMVSRYNRISGREFLLNCVFGGLPREQPAF
ncbi:MAG: transposase [Chitinispirillaceae bacterium]